MLRLTLYMMIILIEKYQNKKKTKKPPKNIKDVHRFGKAFGKLEAMLGNLSLHAHNLHSLVLFSYILPIYLKKKDK